MTKLALKGAFSPNPRVRQLTSGAVEAPGIDIEWTIASAPALHLDHCKRNAFDVFEFPLQGYLLVALNGPTRSWSAIPVFPSKSLFLFDMAISPSVHREGLSALRGLSVALPYFHMSAAVWLRVLLRLFEGVQSSDISWVNLRRPNERHSALLGHIEATPPGVKIEECPPHSSALELYREGRVQAVCGGTHARDLIESGEANPLFGPDDVWVLMARSQRELGFVPPNHIVVVQHRLIERHPSEMRSLFHAFQQAKVRSYKAAYDAVEAMMVVPSAVLARHTAAFGDDPFPYGVELNASMLGVFIDQLVRDGTIPQRDWEAGTLFPPEGLWE